MRRLLALFLLAFSVQAASWTSYTRPGGSNYIAWYRAFYDPLSHSTWFFFVDHASTPGGAVIYANQLFVMNAAHSWSSQIGTSGSGAGTMTVAGTTVTRTGGVNFLSGWAGVGTLISLNANFTINTVTPPSTLTVTSGSPSGTAFEVDCPISTATWFGDRHPYARVSVDTSRNRLYQTGGACSTLYGGANRYDTWRIALNASVGSAVYSRVTTGTTLPFFSGTNQYDPVSDVIFDSSYDGGADTDDFYVFAPTTGGTLSAAQIAAGAATADDWTSISASVIGSNGLSCSPASNNCPHTSLSGTGGFIHAPAMLFLPAIGETFIFGSDDDVTTNQQWLYKASTKTFRKVTTAHHPPNNGTQSSHFYVAAYNTNDAKVYLYDPATTKIWTFDGSDWTDTGAQSGGPTAGEIGVINISTNELQVFGCGAGCTSEPDYKIWALTLPAVPVAPLITSACPTTTAQQWVTYTPFTMTASGDTPLTWSISAGSLPTGMAINSSTGAVSGIPTGTGASSFTVQVANGTAPNDTKACSITVRGATVMIVGEDQQ